MNKLTWSLPEGKKVYFVSDLHLGAPNAQESRHRERVAIEWLHQCAHDAQAIILLGDVFDFWFETPYLVPKGFVRFLGMLGQLADQGIELIFFGGNHDMWQRSYFENEMGAQFFNKPLQLTINDKKFYMAHGDGIGPGDQTYKMIKKLIFLNPLLRWFFEYITPTPLMAFGHFWRTISLRKKNNAKPQWMGEKEWLVQHSRAINQHTHHDYYVFGHRHVAQLHPLDANTMYVNTGEWFYEYNYVSFNGQQLQLHNHITQIS